MLQYLLIGFLGALGAMTRAVVSESLNTTTFPLGTFSVNLLGCLFLGILTGVGMYSSLLPENWRAPIATGFLGSLTTFSTFTVENLKLIETQQWKLFVIHFFGQLLLGFILAGIGLYGSRALLR